MKLYIVDAFCYNGSMTNKQGENKMTKQDAKKIARKIIASNLEVSYYWEESDDNDFDDAEKAKINEVLKGEINALLNKLLK